MKPVVTAIVLLLALPTACGGAVEPDDASKNAGVVGVEGDEEPSSTTGAAEGDGDAATDDDPSSDGGAVDAESTTGASVDPGEPDDSVDVDGSDDGVDDEEDGDATDGDVPVDEDDDGAEQASAVALTRAQLEALYAADDGETGSSTGTTGGDFPALNPADLFLKVSDMGESCDVAYTRLECGNHWSLSIALPPAYQAVGVYDLADPKISQYSSLSETTEPYSTPDDCGWGGGTIGGGTIEVLAIDEKEVRFRVDVASFWEANPNGEYTAIRCQ